MFAAVILILRGDKRAKAIRFSPWSSCAPSTQAIPKACSSSRSLWRSSPR